MNNFYSVIDRFQTCKKGNSLTFLQQYFKKCSVIKINIEVKFKNDLNRNYKRL